MKNNSLHTFVILAYEKSPHLRNCIESIKNQTYPSNIILATTTPNSFISNLAQKYQLHLASSKHINIGSDFDFALHQANTPLVTIAHQDDVYSQNYSREIIKAYQNILIPLSSLLIITKSEIIRKYIPTPISKSNVFYLPPSDLRSISNPFISNVALSDLEIPSAAPPSLLLSKIAHPKSSPQISNLIATGMPGKI